MQQRLFPMVYASAPGAGEGPKGTMAANAASPPFQYDPPCSPHKALDVGTNASG